MESEEQVQEPWDYGRLIVIGTFAAIMALLATQAKQPLPISPDPAQPVVQPDPNCPDGRCPFRRPHVQIGDFYLQF